MTERIDHVAEARQLLADYPSVVGNRPFDVAQVHAMLALVEQQRIANLIAYLEYEDPEKESWKEIEEALGL